MNQTAQLDLFATPAPPPIIVQDVPDLVAQRIVSSGLVHNEFLLSLNASFEITPFSDLPSRMFQFPVEFVALDECDGKCQIQLNHPDFASYAFVDEIEEKTGVRPVWEPLDEYRRDRGSNWRYFHAVDLLTDEHWSDLIRTRNFTDDRSIILGLCYHLDYGGLSVANARAVLAEIKSKEPKDRSAAYLRSDKVRVVSASKGKYVGMESRDAKSVWASIHGIEDGLFKRVRNGHLCFTTPFLAEKEKQTSEATSAQLAAEADTAARLGEDLPANMKRALSTSSLNPSSNQSDPTP